jgi:hypothetical protein
MSDSRYENKLPYSLNKKEWYSLPEQVARLKQIDEAPLSKKAREEALELLEDEYKAECKKVKNAYCEEENRILKEFKDQQVLDFNLGRFSKTTQDKLFSLAWEMGHSSGYSEVHDQYYDLVELLETTLT